MKYQLLLTFQFILTILLYDCAGSEQSNETVIDSNADDPRFVSRILDSAIYRRHLTLSPLRTTSFDFQYLDEDEWGSYFSLIRFDSKNNVILLVKQDSTNRFHSIFEYKLRLHEGKAISELLSPITNGFLTFPDPSRNMLDGGDVSITYFRKDTISIRHWQDNERLEANDKAVILTIINSVITTIQRRKAWWQE